MLSELDIKHRQELNMAGLGPATPTDFPLTFLGSPEFPWQLKNISGITISGAAIMITGCGVHDENGNLIYNAGLLPWQFAGTTALVSSQQGPDVAFVSFIGPPIIVQMPSDLYVYSNWFLRVNIVNPLPGSSYDLTAIFMQGYFRDKYRLSA